MHFQCLIERSKSQGISININSYRKGFINQEDLKDVFTLLGENVSDDEVNSKSQITHSSPITI
jgi:arsenate reductase-like glutaredoxin family protein